MKDMDLVPNRRFTIKEALKTACLPRCIAMLAFAAILTDQASLAQGLRNIGSTKQFFFDDAIVEGMDKTRRRLNPAVKLASNPIIRRDKPWEGPEMRLAWIFYDHALGKFRMRYSTGQHVVDGRDATGVPILKAVGGRICEAFSEDGVHWEKPNLGLVEFEGSTANNIVPDSMHRAYMFEDMHDPDPERRYKGHIRTGEYSGKGMTFSYYYSADGYKWTAYEKNPTHDRGDRVGRWGPQDMLGWDPIRKTYAMHLENNFHTHSPLHRRSIGRSESPDLTRWSEPETIIVADSLDHGDTEFYALPTSFYEDWYVGSLWVFSTTNTTIVPHFVFSRDGLNYNREYREPIIKLGDNGAFDSVFVYAMNPIVHNGEIYIFYDGGNWRAYEQLAELGDRAEVGIGLAKLPLDGFVSLDGARESFSVVTTRSFTFSGQNLFLNVRAAMQGGGAGPCDVRVEILDGRHEPVKGFTLAGADSVSTTGVNQRISWKGNADVSALSGKPVRLKIYFKNAKLYAFQFR